jgi:hypothetical protein
MTNQHPAKSKEKDSFFSSTAAKIKNGMNSFAAMNEREVEDMTLDFFYKPHTISLLFVSVFAAMYFAFIR